jgi:predicted  nucleic acid-binding Zn-ribbon protein
LTKISVVILLVLIVIATPVFIMQATIAPNWRIAYRRAEDRAELADAATQQAQLALNRAMQELRTVREAAESGAEEKQQEISRLEDELSTWKTRSAELQNSLEKLTTNVTGLEKEIQAANQRTEQLAQQLSTSRETIDRLRQENIQVSDLLRDVEARNERLEKQARVLQEQKIALEEELADLRDRIASGEVAAGGAETVTTPAVTQDLTGTVTAVRGDYASVNLGSAQGVQRGMQMIIYRGDQFVANLRVEEVDIAQAAGIITDRRLDPQQGDKVTNRLRQ